MSSVEVLGRNMCRILKTLTQKDGGRWKDLFMKSVTVEVAKINFTHVSQKGSCRGQDT